MKKNLKILRDSILSLVKSVSREICSGNNFTKMGKTENLALVFPMPEADRSLPVTPDPAPSLTSLSTCRILSLSLSQCEPASGEL